MYITQCTHCQTRFKVTPEHLAAYGGQVRCGRCKTVFNANDTLETNAPATPTVPVSALPDEPANEAERIAQTLKQAQHGEWAAPSLADSEPAEPPTSFPVEDFSLDLPDLDTLQDLNSVPANPQHTEPTHTAQHYAEATGQDVMLQEHPEHHQTDFNVEDDIEPDFTLQANEQNAPADPELAVAVSEFEAAFAIANAANPNPAEMVIEPEGLHTDPAPFTSTDTLPDPIKPITPPVKKHRRGVWVWVFLTLLALALLATQLAFVYRSEFSVRSAVAHRYLRMACHHLGCTIPLPQNPNALRTEHAALAFVPDQPTLIRVSATLRNVAPYTMPYPYLQLTLKDGEQHTLAKKVFTPKQYLSEPDLKQAYLKGHSEVNIAMELDIGNLHTSGYSLLWFYP